MNDRSAGCGHAEPLVFSSLVALTTESQGPEVGSVEEQRQKQGYFVRLGSLSARLRHLAYQHSLGKLRESKHRTQEMLAQLQKTLELVSNLSLWSVFGSMSRAIAGGGAFPGRIWEGLVLGEGAGLSLEVGLPEF